MQMFLFKLFARTINIAFFLHVRDIVHEIVCSRVHRIVCSRFHVVVSSPAQVIVCSRVHVIVCSRVQVMSPCYVDGD